MSNEGFCTLHNPLHLILNPQISPFLIKGSLENEILHLAPACFTQSVYW